MRATCMLCLVLTPASFADIVVDTFDPGSNIGGWTFGGPNGSVLPTGGNPGAYWNEPGLDTFAPRLRTTTATSAFTGDFRTREVTRLGVDLVLFHVDFSAGGRPLSLILLSDNGTPGNPNDDWGAYTMHAQNIPLVGEGWRRYDFTVPSQVTALPAGWAFIEFGPGANLDWNALITNVKGVEFFYGNPENFFIFQMWHTGADNVTIETVPAPGVACVLGGFIMLARRRR
ncbi:MAG: hypothetical protein HBSAPP03_12640 [Phycisphaerae bacterium]|nr:MAG: hypothetical protein HBSAPP03_12640 [Phycisphaerae bacterium]